MAELIDKNSLTEKDKEVFHNFEIGRMRFIDYWKTDHWRNKRKEAVLRCGGRCQLCNSHKLPLNAHHRTYNNLWQEKDYDLIVLCRDCHALHHCKVDDVKMKFLVEYLGIPIDDYKHYFHELAQIIAIGMSKLFQAIIEKKRLHKICEEMMLEVHDDDFVMWEEPIFMPKYLDEFEFVGEENEFSRITTKGFVISSLGFLKTWLDDEQECNRLIKLFRGLDKMGEFPKKQT